MFTAVTQTIDASASRVTDWVDYRDALGASITIVVPAGPVGSFTLEGTDDAGTVISEFRNGVTPSAAPYADMSGLYDYNAAPAPTGSAVVYILQLAVPTAFLRLRYTRVSGSGSVVVNYSGR